MRARVSVSSLLGGVSILVRSKRHLARSSASHSLIISVISFSIPIDFPSLPEIPLIQGIIIGGIDSNNPCPPILWNVKGKKPPLKIVG
jgi:hypothetical protein